MQCRLRREGNTGTRSPGGRVTGFCRADKAGLLARWPVARGRPAGLEADEEGEKRRNDERRGPGHSHAEPAKCAPINATAARRATAGQALRFLLLCSHQQRQRTNAHASKGSTDRLFSLSFARSGKTQGTHKAEEAKIHRSTILPKHERRRT